MDRTIGSIAWPAVCRFGLTLLPATTYSQTYPMKDGYLNHSILIKSKQSEARDLNGGYLCGIKDHNGVGILRLLETLKGERHELESAYCEKGKS